MPRPGPRLGTDEWHWSPETRHPHRTQHHRATEGQEFLRQNLGLHRRGSDPPRIQAAVSLHQVTRSRRLVYRHWI